MWSVGKEFSASEKCAGPVSAFKETHVSWAAAALEHGIELKTAEVEFYNEKLDVKSWWPERLKMLEDVYAPLAEIDPVVQNIIDKETWRQYSGLELIASEVRCSRLATSNTTLMNPPRT